MLLLLQQLIQFHIADPDVVPDSQATAVVIVGAKMVHAIAAVVPAAADKLVHVENTACHTTCMQWTDNTGYFVRTLS